MDIPKSHLIMGTSFGDVLGGEFNPLSDPEKRAHTLARLARAAVEKGTEQVKHGHLTTRSEFSYSPSWANMVDVTVTGRRLHETMYGGSVWAGSMNLRAKYDEELGLYLTEDMPDRLVLIPSWEESRTIDLELGPALAETRQVVTDTAQTFFNALTDRALF